MASYGRPVGGNKPKVVKTLHLHQASLEKEDNLNRMREDVIFACNTGADIIGFTEVIGADRRQVFNNAVRDAGLMPIVPTGVGLNTPLAVRLDGDAGTKVKSKGAKLALKGVAKHYENRYISWVQVKWYNQNIWVHEGHWSRTKNGADKHSTVSSMMSAQVKKHGQKDAISFWMGDLNVDDTGDARVAATNLNNIFREAGLLSLFDELHVNPPSTLDDKGVYDVIGCYRPDKQVEGKRYKVWPKQNSNHRQVSGWYDIDITVKASTLNTGNIGPQNEDPDEVDPENIDPDFYATGGNISWDDYLNDDTYPLPFAYGDSDSHRHG